MRAPVRASSLLLLSLLLLAVAPHPVTGDDEADTSLVRPGERHFAAVRQLTFGGENAEAYWSPDGERLIFQATVGSLRCDQIFIMGADGSAPHMVSTGLGRTTCSYFLPDGRILYSSTHRESPDCPPPPDHSRGYVWPLLDYDLYVAGPAGEDPTPLAPSPAYDAEATISWPTRRIVFTSVRDGDLDLYSMNFDGSDLRRLTDEVGYDGGAFFSADGRRIVYRAHHPETPDDVRRYRTLLADGLVEPFCLEIWVMDADGSNRHPVTNLGVASFAPYFHPDGRRIIFSSNYPDPHGRAFDLFLVADDGSGLERVTTEPSFDGFPMFSPDGRRLVFGSNRNARIPGETNVFVADWVE